MRASQSLRRAASAAMRRRAAPPPASAAGKRAAEELVVYLRTMRAAQRRWAREIEAHESNVRRLMIEEEHCRTRLEQLVLKGTREHLKILTNTDLMATSQRVFPPSIEMFRVYSIPAEQINGFSAYVMGCMGANPSMTDVPLSVLLADLSSAWAVLPPTKKDAFGELADIFRTHVPTRASMAAAEAEKKKKREEEEAEEANRARRGREVTDRSDATRHSSKRSGSQKERRLGKKTARRDGAPAQPIHPLSAASSAAAAVTAATRNVVVSAHQRLRGGARKRAASGRMSSEPISPFHAAVVGAAAAAAAATQCNTVGAAARRALSSPRQRRAATSSSAASSSSSSSSLTAAVAAQSKSADQRAARHTVRLETDEVDAFMQRLPPAEHDAFCVFAEESLREMERALGAAIIPVDAKSGLTGGKVLAQRGRRIGKAAVAAAVTAHSTSLPRGVRLFLREWLPIAAEEWLSKTRRQKSLYMTKK